MCSDCKCLGFDTGFLWVNRDNSQADADTVSRAKKQYKGKDSVLLGHKAAGKRILTFRGDTLSSSSEFEMS